ncbi:MAG: hypothetical protein N2645_05590 [Clostridia bacterium]|nr:hypothetical protein [Clostridia bacterium]
MCRECFYKNAGTKYNTLLADLTSKYEFFKQALDLSREKEDSQNIERYTLIVNVLSEILKSETISTINPHF